MDVSIIIVNYNTLKLTEACIDSIFEKTTGITFEVIVIDNASKDGSAEALKRDNRIKVLTSNENLGFGRGNNLGVRDAKGKYVLLLNSDTLLLNNAIKYFYDHFEQYSLKNNLGVLGCILYSPDGAEALSYVPFKSVSQQIGLIISKIKEKFFKIRRRTVQHPKQDIFEVDAVLGADMFMSTQLYKELGGFDSDFFLYGEEVDFQKRIADKAYKRLILRSPRIIHFEGGSSSSIKKQLSFNTIYNLQLGNFIYFRKHHTKLHYLMYKVLVFFTWAPWVIIDKRFNNTEKKSLLQLAIKGWNLK